jgi:hypothetical protein
MLEIKCARWTGTLLYYLKYGVSVSTSVRCCQTTMYNIEREFINDNRHSEYIVVGASRIYRSDENCFIVTNYSHMREEIRNLVNTVTQDFLDNNVKIICKETLVKLLDFAEVLGEDVVVGRVDGYR